MHKQIAIAGLLVLGAGPLPAQQIDCADPANAALDQCLSQAEQRLSGIRNFAPLIGPLLGGGALAALAAGQAASTPSTNR